MLPHRMIIVAGKGGVGRTTVATALGLCLAKRGRRTLLAQVRSKHNAGTLLGHAPVDETITQLEPNLWAVNMDPRMALHEIGMLVLRFRTVYRVVLENRVVKAFLRAIPALEEYSMIGKAWYHTTERREDGSPRYETVIFDGPATGHLISMLRIPQVILDAVPEGPLTVDARKARTLLSDPAQTVMWLVTLAEEMPTSETFDLYAAAHQELNIWVERLIVNGLYPADVLHDPAVSAAMPLLHEQPAHTALSSLARCVTTLRQRRLINEQHLKELARLPLPRIELPYLFSPQLARQDIAQLADQIGRSLDAE